MRKQLLRLISLFLLTANANVASGYNNALNLTFGLQSSTYSNNGILDGSTELSRIGRAIVHMGHEKFLTHPATQSAITALSWLVPMIRGAIWISTGARIVLGTMAAKEGGKELFKFSTTAAKHMTEQGRTVPIQILEQAIKGSKGIVDPKGSRALMHSIEMWKNGKPYTLEVLYDKITNSIWHFQYYP